ncbi:MAG: GNAT family N-acetyltransferase [Chloroflexi bacterium]|nr:GNAT family N-acetyltransferase [Chloroflexota bacterium]
MLIRGFVSHSSPTFCLTPLMLSSAEKALSENPPRRIRLRPKLLGDAIDDYRWRKDPELAHLDATTPVTLSFDEYFKSYQEELERPIRNYFHFGIETAAGRHIGNCMLYDIDDGTKEAQLGILIGEREYWDSGYGQEAVSYLLEKAFEEDGLRRIYLQTLRDNVRAQKSFEKCGFKGCGQTFHNGYDFVVMEIFRDSKMEFRIQNPESRSHEADR